MAVAVRWPKAEISMRTKSPARWETSGAEMASQGEHSYKVTPHASTPLIRVTRWSPSRPFLGGPATKSWMGAPAALRAVSRSIESNHGTAHHSPLPDFSTGGADPIAAFRSETRGQEALREPDVPFLHAAALPQPQNRQTARRQGERVANKMPRPGVCRVRPIVRLQLASRSKATPIMLRRKSN
jgi:hypothetical protein